jgi:hypothetical protein
MMKQETKSMSDAVSEYREYVDVVRQIEPPRARDWRHGIAVSDNRHMGVPRRHDPATVLRPDFFDDLRDVHLKRCDRIEVVASWDQPQAEHATLCVDRIDANGKATVSLLHRNAKGELMAGVGIRIPGQAGLAQARKARMAAAIRWQWNVATAPPEKKIRWPSAGDLGKRLTTASFP